MTVYDANVLMRKITSAAISCINKHTDREDYELIIVDNSTDDKLVFNTKELIVEYDKYLKNDKNLGCSVGNNQGFKLADPNNKYLCFIQNDVFVEENWLSRLRKYLENGYDAVRPSQGHITREQYKEWMNMPYEKLVEERGIDDSGLFLITREAYLKTSGWVESMKYLWHDRGFGLRLEKYNIKIKNSAEPIITHIGGASVFAEEDKIDDKYSEEDPVATQMINDAKEGRVW